MTRINKDSVRDIICNPNHQALIDLDWEKDIKPLFEESEPIQSLSFSSDCFEELIEKVKANTELSVAHSIVVYLVFGCQVNFSFIDLIPLSNCLSNLPYKPDIVLGISKDLIQAHRIGLYLFF